MKTTTITNSKLFQSIITICIFSAFGITQNTLSIEVGDGTIDVLYNSDADIGGFQFTVEGATVTGGSGGDATSNGFMISCSSTMCLGFSLSGAVIPAGSGTLVVVSADITGDVSLSGIVVSDAAGVALDFSFDSGAEEADHVVNAGSYYFYPQNLSITAGETVEWYNEGGLHDVNGVASSITGESFNNPEEFSLGSVSGPATIGSFTFNLPGNYQYDCSIGSHAANGMVGSITVGSGGCTDDMACNYDQEVEFDDGSCLENDCAGECGGDAEVDECGVCGGDGSACASSIIDILYNTTSDIGGFQFNVDGVTILSVSGGAAADAGFSSSYGNNTVLGFSFTGATIPAGSGVLIQVEVDGDTDAACLSAVVLSDAVGGAIDNEVTDCFTISQVEIILGCTDVAACNYNADATEDDGSCSYADENYDCDGNCTAEVDCADVCGGSAVEDCAGECGGSAVEDECGVCGGDGSFCAPGVYGLALNDDGNLDVTFDSPDDIYGFQFDVSAVTVTGVSGGAAADAGFSSSYGNNTVLGFSFSGASIPAGSGVLTVLSFEGSGEACLSNIVVSGYGGEGLETTGGECATIEDACDDVDADGICDDVDDCVGAYDECGVCNGDGIADGACDCAGSVEDCAGVCGGSAVVDECGVCSGDGIADGACDCDGNVDLGCGCGAAGPSGCDNACGSTAEVDECGVCGGDGICAITLSIEIATGWNWFSLNVEGDMSIGSVMASLTSTDGDFIKSASASSTYYPAFGWYGGLDELGVIGMYKFNSANADLLVFSGAPVDPLSTPIDLAPGWNWLGFTPQNDGATADALATITTTEGDFIKNQGASSTYYSSFGWYGGLEVMAPTEGYMLSVAEGSVLTYPNFGVDDALTREKSEKELPIAVSDWEVNYHDYEFNGHITMSIDSREDSHGDYIAVFAGDECRGLAERMYFPFGDSYMYSVMVYSNLADGEELRFKYYDSAIGEIVEYAETIDFTSDMIEGDGFNTFSLNRETSDMQQPIAYGISDAYPNPFNPVTSFEYTLEKDGMVQVAVYDLNGRMVAELVNSWQSAGSYPVVWDAQDLSSGVYMVNMTAGDYSTIQKVMLIK